jgi:hypothetical protein
MVAKGPLRQVFTQSLRGVPDTDHNGRSNFLLLTKGRHGLIQAPIDTNERFLRLKQILAIMHIKDIIPAGIAFVIIRWQPDVDIAGIDERGTAHLENDGGCRSDRRFSLGLNPVEFSSQLVRHDWSFHNRSGYVNGF